jgi:VWA domain-containing protein
MAVFTPQQLESLGPAERIVQSLVTSGDHMVHNRCGAVVADASSPFNVRWQPATVRDGTVFWLGRDKKRTVEVRLGTLTSDGTIFDNTRVVGSFRRPGLFPEVAAWRYRQAADVWQLDNEFAARWASWSFVQEHRDLKVILAALMLVQSRRGDPIREGGELLFEDEDYRHVGEAMCLLRRRDGHDLNPRLLLRVGELLELPAVAQINRAVGFGRSGRTAVMGRYPRVVTKWLQHRERNPAMLQALVKAGYRRTVMKLARKVGYKPLSTRFFEVLRWRQKQADDGRRTMAIGQCVAAAETWEGLTEFQICERIVSEKPSYKRIVGMLPAEIGLTRAIMAASIEAGCVSDAEMVILTPTIEELGLLDVTEIGERWLRASHKAENQRAAHIAQRVRRKDAAERLQDAADRALQKSVAEVTRDLRVYCAVDVSASMTNAIEKAKGYLSQFLQGFALEKLTVCAFSTTAREVKIRHASARGVEHAFRGLGAGGGTNYGSAFRQVFRHHPPSPKEDVICLFVGDQQQPGTFYEAVVESGIQPVAFGFLYVPGNMGNANHVVDDTAARLEIPCFRIEEGMFGDAYAVSRTLHHLIASTPVGATGVRQSLVMTILETPLLTKPVWA